MLYKKKEIREGGKVGNTGMTYRDLLTKNVEEIKSMKEKKQGLNQKIDKLTEKLEELEREKQDLFKNVSKDYPKVEQI